MTGAQWRKPGIFIALIGIMALATLAVFRNTRPTAPDITQTSSPAPDQVQACLEKTARDPSRTARLALLQQATLDTRRDLLMDTGWATPSGSGKADPNVAKACLDALALTSP